MGRHGEFIGVLAIAALIFAFMAFTEDAPLYTAGDHADRLNQQYGYDKPQGYQQPQPFGSSYGQHQGFDGYTYPNAMQGYGQQYQPYQPQQFGQ